MRLLVKGAYSLKIQCFHKSFALILPLPTPKVWQCIHRTYVILPLLPGPTSVNPKRMPTPNVYQPQTYASSKCMPTPIVCQPQTYTNPKHMPTPNVCHPDRLQLTSGTVQTASWSSLLADPRPWSQPLSGTVSKSRTTPRFQPLSGTVCNSRTTPRSQPLSGTHQEAIQEPRHVSALVRYSPGSNSRTTPRSQPLSGTHQEAIQESLQGLSPCQVLTRKQFKNHATVTALVRYSPGSNPRISPGSQPLSGTHQEAIQESRHNLSPCQVL